METTTESTIVETVETVETVPAPTPKYHLTKMSVEDLRRRKDVIRSNVHTSTMLEIAAAIPKTTNREKVADKALKAAAKRADDYVRSYRSSGEDYLAHYAESTVRDIAQEAVSEAYNIWVPKEAQQFSAVCKRYNQAPKFVIDARRHLRVLFSEQYSEDPSDMLAKLIDEIGLDYIEMDAEEAIFEPVAEELVEEIGNIIGVVRARHKVQVYISFDGGPFRPRVESDPTLPAPKPKSVGLPYDVYAEVCIQNGLTPEKQRPVDGWRTGADYSRQLAAIESVFPADQLAKEKVERDLAASHVTTQGTGSRTMYRVLDAKNEVFETRDYDEALEYALQALAACPERKAWKRALRVYRDDAGGAYYELAGRYSRFSTLDSALAAMAKE